MTDKQENNKDEKFRRHAEVQNFIMGHWAEIVDFIEGEPSSDQDKRIQRGRMFVFPEVYLFQRPGDPIINSIKEQSTVDCFAYNGNGRIFLIEIGPKLKKPKQINFQMQEFNNYFPGVPCVGVIAKYQFIEPTEEQPVPQINLRFQNIQFDPRYVHTR